MQIEHLALWVSDLETIKAFYAQLGGRLAQADYVNPRTGFRSCFVSFDQGARLELMQRADVTQRVGAPEAPLLGYAHLALALGSREAVDALTARMQAAGHLCFSAPRVTGDGYYESVIVDPEGNLVELTA